MGMEFNAGAFIAAVESMSDADIDFIEKAMNKEASAWVKKTKVTLKKEGNTIVFQRTGTRSFTVNGRSRTSRTPNAAAEKFGDAIFDKLIEGWSWGKFKSPIKRKKIIKKRSKKKKKKTFRKKKKTKKKKKKKKMKKKKKDSKKKICKKRGCKKPIPKQKGRGRPRKYCKKCGS